jgi:hypothetical protein
MRRHGIDSEIRTFRHVAHRTNSRDDYLRPVAKALLVFSRHCSRYARVTGNPDTIP